MYTTVTIITAETILPVGIALIFVIICTRRKKRKVEARKEQLISVSSKKITTSSTRNVSNEGSDVEKRHADKKDNRFSEQKHNIDEIQKGATKGKEYKLTENKMTDPNGDNVSGSKPDVNTLDGNAQGYSPNSKFEVYMSGDASESSKLDQSPTVQPRKFLPETKEEMQAIKAIVEGKMRAARDNETVEDAVSDWGSIRRVSRPKRSEGRDDSSSDSFTRPNLRQRR